MMMDSTHRRPSSQATNMASCYDLAKRRRPCDIIYKKGYSIASPAWPMHRKQTDHCGRYLISCRQLALRVFGPC